jgi:hypothetical protein
MVVARQYQTATLLPSGEVLIAGGYDFSDLPLASAELYDPATGRFSAVGSMPEARAGYTATLLGNGTELIAGGVGGEDGEVFASAELYAPSAGTFATIGSMITARVNHTATLLPSGEVLIAGGADVSNDALASAELYQ